MSYEKSTNLERWRVDEVPDGVPDLDLVALLRHDGHVEVDVAQPHRRVQAT